MRAGANLGGLVCVLLASCATTQAGSASPTRSPGAAPAYEGRCSFLAIEQVDAPSDQNSDAVALVARYRFADASASAQPLELFFQVSRSRVHDLTEHLNAHANVLCSPEHIDVPPFEGQSGTTAE